MCVYVKERKGERQREREDGRQTIQGKRKTLGFGEIREKGKAGVRNFDTPDCESMEEKRRNKRRTKERLNFGT